MPDTEDNEREHNHIPWGLILIQAVINWRCAHQGKLPKKPAEKIEFVESIKAMRHKDAAGKVWNGENFGEAIENAFRCYSEHEVDFE